MTDIDISGIPTNINVNDEIGVEMCPVDELKPLISHTFVAYLQDMKSRIDSVPDEWDHFKKYTNVYEFIHTQHPKTKMSVCPLTPLSRSFFKIVEICRQFKLLDELGSEDMQFFSFAEGPGGFIQGLAHMRANSGDQYYGMTLRSDSNTSVPGWRKTKEFLQSHQNVHTVYGASNTGDLLRSENLLWCHEEYSGRFDFITGDGGFDFTNDFSKQEANSLALCFAQVAFALAAQRENGTFVLKVFDITTAAAVDLVFLLANNYRHIRIYKPHSSRSANSEKYIICTQFMGAVRAVHVRYMAQVLGTLANGMAPRRFLTSAIPYAFITKLQEANAVFGQLQIESISQTLSVIRRHPTDKIDSLVRNNTAKCVSWCQKYKLPYNKSSNVHTRRK